MFKLFLPFVFTTVIVTTLAITPVYLFGDDPVAEFTLSPSVRVIAVDLHGDIQISDNNGTNWTGVYEAGGYQPLTSIITLQNGNLIAGGLSWDKPALFRSTNNGNNWAAVGAIALDTYSLRQIGSTVFAFGVDKDGASIYRSLDNGLTWIRVLSRPNEGYFVNGMEIGSNIIAIQNGGQTYRSTDGGVSFNLVASNLVGQARDVIKVIKAGDNSLYAISIKPGIGWPGGNLFKSSNGITWTVQYTSGALWFNNLIEVAPGEFYTLASHGSIASQTLDLMHSTDYGLNWSQSAIIKSDVLSYDDTRFGLILLPDHRLLIGAGRPGEGVIYRTDSIP